jgi:hypothetical protein
MMDHGGDVGCPGSGEREELARRREQRMSAAKIAASLPLSGRTGKTRRGRPEKEKPRNPNKIENFQFSSKSSHAVAAGGCVETRAPCRRAGVGDRRVATGVLCARRLGLGSGGHVESTEAHAARLEQSPN